VVKLGTPVGSLNIPQIAERLNDLMQTRKGRLDIASVINGTSQAIQTQIKDWIDKELQTLHQQLDLLEMAHWNLSLERTELQELESDFEKITLSFEEIPQTDTISSEQKNEMIEKYIETTVKYIRTVVKLGDLIAKVNNRSNDLLKYRDALYELLRSLGQQPTS
jgi:hypothetical protein